MRPLALSVALAALSLLPARPARAETGPALVIMVDAKLKPGTGDAYKKSFAELFKDTPYPEGLLELFAVTDTKDPLHARMMMVWRSKAEYEVFLGKVGKDGKGPTRMALESLGATYVRETFDVKTHLTPPPVPAKPAPAKPAKPAK